MERSRWSDMQRYVILCFVINLRRSDLRVTHSTQHTTESAEGRRTQPSPSTSKHKHQHQLKDILRPLCLSHRMQSSGRALVSSARYTVLRLSRQTSANVGIRNFYSRPPPTFQVSSVVGQRRGYRRTPTSLKEDEDKRSKSGKEVDKPTAEEVEKQQPVPEVESPENEQEAKVSEKAVESSAKDDKSVESSESTGTKEKRTREPKNQKTPEESARPAVAARNQALSLVANNGNKARLIITNHDHPETYPQCMALAMSGRPILPGFYSTLLLSF